MADGDSHSKPLRLVPEVVHSSIAPNQEDPSKFPSKFLYKALTFAIFLVILPLFPSEAPEFVNQAIPTRGWELLHLLFVGIAVSYGLFSRRNDEPEKENYSKIDNAQSYMSRLLQVSSVFDDEAESPCGSDDNKVQTWSSQYFREEPVVMVAQKSSALDEQGGLGSGICEKPLVLPVRSLKYSVSNVEVSGPVLSRSSNLGSRSRSNSSSGSEQFGARIKDFWDPGHLELKGKFEDNIVLRSPIPWRSRSGKMEMKKEFDCPPSYSLPPLTVEAEFSRSNSLTSVSQISEGNADNSSPRKLSPSPSHSSARKRSSSPSLSSELQSNRAEDMSRNGIHYKMSSPPPAPPAPLTPPPPIAMKTSLLTANSRLSSESFHEKDFIHCLTNELKDSNRSGREECLRRVSSEKEAKPRSQTDRLTMGKSVRTVRSEPANVSRRAREMGESRPEMERRTIEVDPLLLGKTGRKMSLSEEEFPSPKKCSLESQSKLSKPTSLEFQEDSESADKFNLESASAFQEWEEEEADDKFSLTSSRVSENEHNGNGLKSYSGTEEAASSILNDAGPDVDKKADEFIAKFREQIRLQRIESFRRSSSQVGRKSLR